MTNWVGITIDSTGNRVETGSETWCITRSPRWGITIGLVWGTLRRPFSVTGRNPWFDPNSIVLRIPWIILPWFHVWRWRDKRSVNALSHPARLYFGGKLFKAHARPGEDLWREVDKDPVGWYVAPSASLRIGTR